ncbi:hypothetical protein ADK52_12110 [Streptomyces sp. WM6372]|nr:hypothetical protein ADK52_12110 [Streptomyces sp. WM6372]
MADAGRAVLLSQALETRSDLTDLREQHPALAERFADLRRVLDQDPVTAASDAPNDHRSAGRERSRMAAEFEQVRGRIRACEGFAHFALPPSREELLEEAAHGPVVTFNVNRHRSDALLLTRHGISSVPLPALTRDTVVEQVLTFHWALANATAQGSDRIAAQRMLRGILEWLWEAAAEPVLAALEDLGETVPHAQDGQSLPRVWWAPGGLLGMLPLHAAGFHTEPAHGPHRRTVLDRVISSYTPTIRALRHARTRCPRPAGRSLIVAMPTTPGHAPLRHVPEEARRIRDLLHCPVQLTEPAPAPDGTPGPAGIGTPTDRAGGAARDRAGGGEVAGGREGAAVTDLDQDAGSGPDAYSWHGRQDLRKRVVLQEFFDPPGRKFALVKAAARESARLGTISAAASVPGTMTVCPSRAVKMSSTGRSAILGAFGRNSARGMMGME